MKLQDRINQDLTDRYTGREIAAAKSLAKLIDVSTKGLPQHFVGKGNAKTILVMLNPGQDAASADKYFRCATLDYDRSSAKAFISSYIADKTYYGKNDRNREDSFDIKQAAFLKAWMQSGVRLPSRFPTDKKTFLAAKEAVLMQKLQLELVPYCSSKFKFKQRDLSPLFPFVETMLEEIFSKKRRYVVFCADLFQRVFKSYNKHVGEMVFAFGTGRKRKILKEGGTRCGTCMPVEIRFQGKMQKALIANTFASHALSNGYELMEKYGAFCFEVFQAGD